MKKLLGVVFVLIVIGAIIGASHKKNSPSSSSSENTPAASQSSAPKPKAHVTILTGANSDNSCTEAPGEARIYVVITLRNSGGAAANINPWASFDYSDGGNSTESYDTNYGHNFTLPAHSVRDATFYHTYNPQQHSMIRCAGFADLADTNASGYYLPNQQG